jgi:Ca-activated chloride channel homolog
MGRHTAPRTRRHARPPRRLGARATAALAAVLTAAVAVPATLLWLDREEEATEPAGGAGCSQRPVISVAVAPQIAPVVQSAARRASAAGACASYSVQAAAPAAVSAAIAAGDSPDAWVSDSSLWIEQLAATEAANPWRVAASLASSPIVLAMPTHLAAKVGSARPQWRTLLTGQTPVRMADPEADATGRLALFTVRSALGSSEAARRISGASMIRLSRTAAGSESELFDAYAQEPAGSPAFPASEQAVADFNRTHAGSTLAAVIPAEGTATLDYPWSTADGLAPATRALTDRLLAEVRSDRGAADIAAAGFRAAGGSGSPRVAGIPSGPVKLVKAATAEERTSALELWTAVRTDMRMLAVMDVSGSMKARAGDRSRIELARDAALTALSSFPQSSQVGLWEFSTDRGGPGRDHRALAPIRTLTDPVGGGTHKDALGSELAKMPRTVAGDTGLYDTLLAAYRSVKESYQPGYVNSVVLLTDGVNEDAQGISLEQLLAGLRSERDPRRPVRVILVGLGAETDARTLATIARTAGGASFVAADPQDITTVFIQALMTRG